VSATIPPTTVATATVIGKTTTDMEGKKLISSSPADQSTAAASSGGAASIVVVLLWILSLFKIPVPPEVAAAFVVMIGAVVHYVVILFAMPVAITKTSSDNPITTQK
jgi:glucan phosphoethanolaminetransferase (alkaline phosphatase superfamily)